MAEIPPLAVFLGPSLTFQPYTHHLPLITAPSTSPPFRKPCRHAKDPLCCHPYIGHCRYVRTAHPDITELMSTIDFHAQ